MLCNFDNQHEINKTKSLISMGIMFGRNWCPNDQIVDKHVYATILTNDVL